MGILIAGWIEAAITLSAALLLLKFYYTSKMPFFYKKKWVIVVCAITMLCSLIEVTQAYINYAQGRTPCVLKAYQKL